jgi:erythromycin esterase
VIGAGRPAVLAVAVAVAVVALAAVPAVPAGARATSPSGPRDPVARWVDRHAAPLATADPAASLDDLGPLRDAVGDAEVVGLGEAVHGAAEIEGLKLRVLRTLVEDLGFRTVAWEDDWFVGREIDEYVRTGVGDPEALVAQMSPQWQTQEVVEVLRWLRAFDAGRADPVRVVGVEHYLTPQGADDAVDAYVARVAPDRLAELRGYLGLIRPATSDVFAHIQWYQAQADKGPYRQAAQAVLDLVDGLPHGPGDLEHELKRHQAEQIWAFYEHFSLSEADALVFRDERAAADVRWWHDLTGDRIAYWAASPHTAVAPDIRLTDPPNPERRYPTAGSHLRATFGDGYRSIGFTFDHGAVTLGPAQTVVLPPPRPEWFERPLGTVAAEQLVVDLRGRARSGAVRRWLHGPIATRGLPDAGPDAAMLGGSLGEWFDVVVHRQVVTPATPLVPPGAAPVTALRSGGR